MKSFQVVILSMILILASTDDDVSKDSSAVKTDTTKYGKTYLKCEELKENKRPSSKDSYPDDGCGDFSVRFKDNGYCYPLLKQGPCSSIYEWVTVDPDTYMGRCTPRLCGRDRVFVECTGLCHNMMDKDLCRGGRRLFYSAYGKPICDCPIGQYPFPKEGDDCVPIFTQGPCPDYEVVTPTSSGKLECKPNVCKAPYETIKDFILQLFPFSNKNKSEDTCYAMGTIGPCYSSDKVVGYDIFDLKGKCIDLKDPTTPYFLSSELNSKLDKAYNEDDDLEYKKVNKTIVRRRKISKASRIGRQANTFGAFQVNNNLVSSMLAGCQPGNRNGNNVKCANPLTPDRQKRDISATRNSVYGCNQNDMLRANGRCATNNPCPQFHIRNPQTGLCEIFRG